MRKFDFVSLDVQESRRNGLTIGDIWGHMEILDCFIENIRRSVFGRLKFWLFCSKLPGN